MMRIDPWKPYLLVAAIGLSMLTGCAGAAPASPTSTVPVVETRPPAAASPVPATPSPTATRPPVATRTAATSPTAARPASTAASVATIARPAPTATRVATPVGTSRPGPTATRPTPTAAGTRTAAPAIAITNLTPAPNSTVPAGVDNIIAANVISDIPVASVTVFLDGARIDVEVGGQSETRLAFFTGRILAPGTHTVRAVVTGRGAGRAEAQWSFTAAATTPTPARSS